MNLKNKILSSISHRFRKKIEDQIIIIESDDWGLERALHEDAIKWMEKKYGRNLFSRWSTDCLETSEDLFLLYEVLEKHKNNFRKRPVITANFIMFNVNIESNNLYFRSINNGFSPLSEDVRPLYFEGINKGYIFPQLHGYCHYNPLLVEQYAETDEALEASFNGFFLAKTTIKGHLSFLHGEMSEKNPYVERNFSIAQCEFEKFFGFKSSSFIPPTFILDSEFFNVLKKNKISYLQAANRYINSKNEKYFYPYLRRKNNIIWGIRNARLDPHVDYNFDHEKCLKNIESAFKNKMPAIIDFHRVNFSGKYNPSYRDNTLKELNQLFIKISKNWPNAIFLNTLEFINVLYGTQESY